MVHLSLLSRQHHLSIFRSITYSLLFFSFILFSSFKASSAPHHPFQLPIPIQCPSATSFERRKTPNPRARRLLRQKTRTRQPQTQSSQSSQSTPTSQSSQPPTNRQSSPSSAPPRPQQKYSNRHHSIPTMAAALTTSTTTSTAGATMTAGPTVRAARDCAGHHLARRAAPRSSRCISRARR